MQYAKKIHQQIAEYGYSNPVTLISIKEIPSQLRSFFHKKVLQVFNPNRTAHSHTYLLCLQYISEQVRHILRAMVNSFQYVLQFT